MDQLKRKNVPAEQTSSRGVGEWKDVYCMIFTVSAQVAEIRRFRQSQQLLRRVNRTFRDILVMLRSVPIGTFGER